jgi:L-iditol 2-dehydrogenase
MKAWVAHGAGDFRLSDLPMPRARRGALVRVEAAGVCAADRMIWRGDSPWQLRFPFTPGHELLGRITDIDPETQHRWGLGPGDRVTAEVMAPCGQCRLCQLGRSNLCRRGRHLGSDLPGAFAEYLVLPPDARVWPVPDGLATAAAAIAEPVACAVHAVRRARVTAGDLVAIAGIGAIGAAAVAVAAGKGARVVAVVTSPEKGEVAVGLGAERAVPSDEAATALLDLTGGCGVDVFLECSGSAQAAQLGLDATIPGGRVLLYGVYRVPATVDWNQVAEFKELEVRGGHLAPNGAFGEAIDLLARGAVDADRIVTHRHPLEEFEAALGDPEDGGLRLKAIVEPGP